jgi:hypothetical protein
MSSRPSSPHLLRSSFPPNSRLLAHATTPTTYLSKHAAHTHAYRNWPKPCRRVFFCLPPNKGQDRAEQSRAGQGRAGAGDAYLVVLISLLHVVAANTLLSLLTLPLALVCTGLDSVYASHTKMCSAAWDLWKFNHVRANQVVQRPLSKHPILRWYFWSAGGALSAGGMTNGGGARCLCRDGGCCFILLVAIEPLRMANHSCPSPVATLCLG